MSISNLEPKSVWENFDKICKIPHPSKCEAEIIKFTKEFGEKLGLETIVDEVGNVIIKKPATPGMENRMGIILQGHLDMVPQKNSDTVHDFEKDPIQTYIDGEWLTAKGTTLGADNGIGCAAAMAVLQANDLVHGPIEALFTIDEETGMTGAFNLKPGLLDGDILLNMDSEDEGELYIGCAGGMDGNIDFKYASEAVPAGVEAFELRLTGLKGGHSGLDIPLGRGNANKLLNRFVKDAVKDFGVRIATFKGGSLRNAISREAFAIVTVPFAQKNDFLTSLNNFRNTIINEFSVVEPNFSFEAISTKTPDSLMDEDSQNKLIRITYALPHGVYRMSDTMPGVVETSNNVGIIVAENNKVSINCLMRSSVDSAKFDIANVVGSIAELAGANIVFEGEYPGWKPNVDSPILAAMKESYNKKYGKVPEVKVIHAGLECGILGASYPHWDMISFGPTIRSPHSPDEKVNIKTVGLFWDFLVETLKNAPVK